MTPAVVAYCEALARSGAVTPPALLGEVWRGTIGDEEFARNVAIVRRNDGLRAVAWRHPDGWCRTWDETAAAIFRAWGETMAAERDAARGVAQLAVEEAAALRKQLGRAQDELDAYRDERRGRATP